MAAEHIDPTDLTMLETLPDLIAGILERAAPASDPSGLAKYQQAVIEKMFPDPPVRRLVPAEYREQINIQSADEYRENIETGVLHEIGAHVHNDDYARVLDRVEAAAVRPPSARGAWLDRTGLRSTSSTDSLLIELIDLQRSAAVDQTLRAAPPSRVLAAYVFDEDDSTGAVRRYVEQQHADGWRGVTTDDVAELAAVQALRQAITTERQARIPPAVQAARQALARAADVLRRVEVTSGLKPRRPAADLYR